MRGEKRVAAEDTSAFASSARANVPSRAVLTVAAAKGANVRGCAARRDKKKESKSEVDDVRDRQDLNLRRHCLIDF